jgi:pyruvate formate lyase activating enzyme
MAYTETIEGKIHCKLCPNGCVIGDGHTGICRVRSNADGELELPLYGRLSSVSVDPIEKKPLYHFHPGEPILSVGFFGCSFRCPFCQNYRISQETDPRGRVVPPESIPDMAAESGSFAVAYTYNEPTIHFEYVMAAAAAARERGLKNVLVSNGYLNPEPAKELLSVLDAANIDLKSFDEEFYSKEIGGRLEPVKEFIRIASRHTSLEVTTLVIPGKNDSEAEIGSIAEFLASLDENIPYHLSCYYPTYKYSIPPTQVESVLNLVSVARRSLNYVYAGNVGGGETNTYCPECDDLLVQRSGYRTKVAGIEDGICMTCGKRIPITGV